MNVRELKVKLNKLLGSDLKRQIGERIGQEMSQDIKERTQKGFGVDAPKGPKTRLKPLSPKYIKQRRYLQRTGQLASETTPQKSNLTKTGKMLNDIGYKATKDGVIISLRNFKNRLKAGYNAAKGRIFLNLSKTEYLKVQKIVEEEVKKDIKKNGL